MFHSNRLLLLHVHVNKKERTKINIANRISLVTSVYLGTQELQRSISIVSSTTNVYFQQTFFTALELQNDDTIFVLSISANGNPNSNDST